ncbi:hypothetical protein JTE90_028608 [Oedothorax gibbosus]|uniref:DUF8040 domain-containing protein n=1 Tax=Oedothorax gibbosus TaxID=931172 RepID=A0AAV6TZ38_9ARAC|nr:hypothetical protein JTE90_028608 [Oedothorax gibbosus]
MTVLSKHEKNRVSAALAAVIVSAYRKKQQKKRTVWTRNWLLRRKVFGCYENLMRELALEDSESYRRWLRMDVECFEYLLRKVQTLIEKKDTNMRRSISAGERLALTLRYLATGETQRSLAFQFRIAQNSISGIIPSVCKAICQALQEEFLKVPDCPDEWRAVATEFFYLWNFPMFRVYKSPILTPPANAIHIVMATCCLHNFLRSRCLELYSPLTSIDHEDITTGSLNQGTWRNDTNAFLPFIRRYYRGSSVAKEVRERLKNYFNGVGAVPWQGHMSNLH